MEVPQETIKLIATALIMKNGSKINLSSSLLIDNIGQDLINKIYDEMKTISNEALKDYSLDEFDTNAMLIDKILKQQQNM
ncbi:hypothetical protein [Aliarcobacter butzleri]|uniref:hypothetical protein n=1 Tax=Aliarcobacter butzleri TaxID=28197 RepID=UPI001269BC85|nr:hypothetical protein [Aliarcobacter butzleri]